MGRKGCAYRTAERENEGGLVSLEERTGETVNIAYNMDCMEAMRDMPDNAFDLAVVDPPYGGGFTEGGGCKGWFTKYHQHTQEISGGG